MEKRSAGSRRIAYARRRWSNPEVCASVVWVGDKTAVFRVIGASDVELTPAWCWRERSADGIHLTRTDLERPYSHPSEKKKLLEHNRCSRSKPQLKHDINTIHGEQPGWSLRVGATPPGRIVSRVSVALLATAKAVMSAGVNTCGQRNSSCST